MRRWRWGCSENRAGRLLAEGLGLAELPGGLEAVEDLLLGRERLPLDHDHDHAHDRPVHGSAAPCGCLPGAPVPCGADVLVHLRWETGVGMSDEPAELVGHGPIEPDLVAELLLAAPRLRVVWTDEHGVPVAFDNRVVVPPRGDPQAVRQALLDLARRPPPPRQPRAPDDHARTPGPAAQASEPVADAGHVHAPRPEEEPGPYRPPRRVRRLTTARAPRCEWPGCGARAVVCDAEHDLAWPAGPTCPCNLGPCCRRHHRVKQCGWVKTRHRHGSLTWTAPTGSTWLSPAQHPAPEPATRLLRPVPTQDPLGELDPQQLEATLWDLGLLPDDDLSSSHTPADQDVPDSDRLGHRLVHGDTRWTLDLQNPYLWIEGLTAREVPAGR
jgi:hypothetical protein